MLSLYEILRASKTGIAPDMWTALAGKNWGSADSGHEIKELTGIPPLSFSADGTPLLDYLISGNMSQTGTPTPQNPIQPQECGERTGNLLPEFYATSGEISGNSYTITKNSIETHNDESVLGAYYVLTEFGRCGNYANYAIIDEKHSFKIPAGTYTFSGNENIHSAYNGLCLIVGQLGKSVSGATSGAEHIRVGQTFTINEDSYVCPVIEIRYDSQVDEYILTNPMLNTGSTALPYEPWGIKMSISSANTTTPVYLGEVKTTRKIYKYEFKGSETWSVGSENYYSLVPETSGDGVPYSSVICSHCSGSTINNTRKAVFVKKSEFPNITTGAELKQYCLEQYAAGTPVTIWYVLAEPTTGIVNEPLRKIGNYADTLSMEQAGVSVPTLHGNTVIDVETELKPSEMYIKYQE